MLMSLVVKKQRKEKPDNSVGIGSLAGIVD
jgi:hypothetical protein